MNLLLLSMEAALRRGDLPLFPPSGFSIHHELFPVPSFWTRTKRLCSDRLCLMEFWRRRRKREKPGEEQTNREICACPFPKTLQICFSIQVQIHPYRWLSFINMLGLTADLRRRKGEMLRSLNSGMPFAIQRNTCAQTHTHNRCQ